MAYAFRFYGRSPSAWAEGGDLGHRFDVQFAREPSAAERAELGARWHAATAAGVAEGGPWLWSGRFAAFVVGERRPSRGGHLGVVADFLARAHELVPIADATYHNAREGQGPWDVWSLAAGPPDPGPAFRSRALAPAYRRAVDPALPAPAPDAAFDGGVRGAFAARRADPVAALLAPATPGKVGLARAEGASPPPPRFDPALWGCFRVADPPLVETTGAHGTYVEAASGDHPIAELSRPLAWVARRGSSFVGVAWLDGRGERRESLFGGGYAGGLALSPDGGEALCRQSYAAWRLSLASGEARAWYHKEPEDGYELRSTAFAAGGRWALLASKRLLLFAPGEAPRLLATAPVADATDVRAAREGRALVVTRRGGVSVFACLGDRLARVGDFDAPLDFAFENEGGVYLRHGGGLYELAGLDAALVRRAPRPPRRPAAGAAPALSAAPVDRAPRPDAPPDAARAALGEGRFYRGPGGHWAVVPRTAHGGMAHFWGLTLRAPDGRVDDLSAAVERAGGAKSVDHVAFSPSGRAALACVGVAAAGIAGRLVAIEGGETRAAFDNVWAEHGKVCGLAFVAEGEALLLAERSLRRLRRGADGTWAAVGSLKLSKACAMAVGAPRGVPAAAIVGAGARPLVLIAAPPGDRLRKVAELSDPVRAVDWPDELYACDGQGRWWRVEGAAEAVTGAR